MLPVRQEDVWKKLNMSHQHISRVVRDMERCRLLERRPITKSGACKTFMLARRAPNFDKRKGMVVKKISLEELKRKIISMLPVRQDDVWKTLMVRHQQVSLIVRRMIAEGVITRSLIRMDGARKTYLLARATKIDSVAVQKEDDNKFSPLLSDKGQFSPCTGCKDDCDAATCKKLIPWTLGV